MGDRKTFDQAKTKCTDNGGRLAIIGSAELNTFLTSIVSPALSSPACYWFGLSRSADAEPFTWNDVTQISNPIWAPGEPSSTGQACACLWSDGNDADNHGQWDGRSCGDTLPYICERPQVPTGQWTYISGVQNVQYLISTLDTSFFNAREFCHQIGGQLAQLKTSNISSAVRNQFGNIGNGRFWFGLDDLSKEGDFRWADGTLLRNTGFTGGNLNNQRGKEHCVETTNSGWNDLPCSGQSRRFVCEKSEAPPLHLLAMTSTPFGSSGATPRFSCILSPPDNTDDTVSYTERVIVQSLTTEGYTLDVPGTKTTQTGGLIQDLPGDVTSVGLYKCSSTSTTTGISTSADVTILSKDRHFQPTDGRLTKTIYPGDDITLSVSTTDTYTAGEDEIRWRTFSNLAEGSLSPEGDRTLTYTIRSATKTNADVHGTVQNGMVENLMYSLIRVIVSDCPSGRWNIPSCDRLCDNCYNGGICHPQSGTCICPPGFMGKNCLTACGENRFGWECELECGAGNALQECSGSQVCLPDPYGCNCLAGYTGIYCDKQCIPGRFGVDCLQDCHCAGGMPCNAFTGRCEGDCEDGWSGEGCQVPSVCPVGYFGINCTELCNCPEYSKCEKDSGFCTSSGGQCEIGYVADSPQRPDGCVTFAGCFESCSKTCHCAGGVEDCNQVTGTCSQGTCHPRWMGDKCQTDRFSITREKTNPGVAMFSCTFSTDTSGNIPSIKATVGDFSMENWENAQAASTATDQFSLKANFTFSVNVNGNQPIYCLVGTSTSGIGFAFIRLPLPETFVLPVFNKAPEVADLGFNYVIIAWDSWTENVDVGEGPIIGYKVYVTTSDGDETNTFITSSGVPMDMESSGTVSSRKRRQEDEGLLMYNVTGLDDGQAYEIQISAVREGLNGEGEKGPALSVTTIKIALPPDPSAIGASVGGAIGGIIFVLLIIVIIIIVLRRRRNPRNEVSKPVTYRDDNVYIGGLSEEVETGKSDKPKTSPTVTPRKPVVLPKPSTMPEPQLAPNGLDEADVPKSRRSEESPKERRPIPLSQFATLVQKNRHTDVFYEEFLCLPKANIFPQTVAEKKVNFEKNRYKNILPYDSSRVRLAITNDDPNSDYFNASYIPSFRNQRAYIASQGPNNASMDDFWRMVWQENVNTIAMVTKLQEGTKIKCRQYWPESTSVNFGDIVVVLSSVASCCGGLKRTLSLTKGAKTRVVNQFHFTEWPDKAVPNSTSTLQKYISEVKKDHGQNSSPLLVHCSAGVGRTGVLLSIDSVVAEAKRTKEVDIFGYVTKIRQNRPYMVQTKEQYQFVYVAVLEALLSEDTRIQASYFESTLMHLQKVTINNKRRCTPLSTQFENLTVVCPDPPASLIRTATKTENRSKSRYANSLPMERNRVILQSRGSSDSDFVNASFVKGNRYRFITTQMPMPNTVADFWAMVIDYQPSTIVMLNDDNKRDKSCARYWFDKGVKTFGPVSVTTLSISERRGFIEREIEVTQNKPKARHVVKQYQFVDWPTKAEERRDRAPYLLNLMTEVEDSFSGVAEGFPVLVHCLNGVGRTGVFCTMLECIAQINEEDAVDVFQMVKMLRNERMHFVQTEV
ncbi:uncharacterized protein LOC115924937 [Strongylocentrotus purpuratus]|uniref:protein-tyrosine-phosphatase n=1 Tax=Strongylocentrotus purpuratus TaxID=7668 RepID=A0A7M7NZJ5_STRPU|nr:uncharacterized protein LOC115924937 [Strongylocentrotus purpuratus]